MIYRYYFTKKTINLFLIIVQMSAGGYIFFRYTLSSTLELELYSALVFLSIFFPMILLFYDAMNGLNHGRRNQFRYHRYYSKEIGIDVNDISNPYPAKYSRVFLKKPILYNILKTAYSDMKNKEYDKAQYLYGSLINSNIKDPAVYHNMAYIFYNKNYYTDACRLFLKACIHIKKSTRNRRAKSRFIKKAYYDAGNCYFKINEYNKALSYYSRSLNEDPKYLPARENMIITKIAKGSLDEAYEDYLDMMNTTEIKPFSHNLHIFMGRAFEQKKQLDNALDAYKKAKEIRRNPDIMHQIAKLLYNVSRFKEAADEYEEMILRYPDNKKAYLGLGLSYYKMDDLQRAKEAFEKILDIDEAKYNYLLILFKQKEYNKALPVISELMKVNTGIRELKLLSAFFMKLEKYYDAIKCLRSAIEIKPDDFDLCLELGSAYMHIKDLFSASEWYSKAFFKRPEDPLAAALLLRSFIESGMLREAKDMIERNADKFDDDKNWKHLISLV